jgi:asparagine N-glycosylation enzyme membrane subunit Stt3
MYEFIQKFHSGWAYLALLLLIVAVVISLLEFLKKEFTAKNRKIALFALIAIHVQLLVGIILYFVSPNGFNMIKAVGMGGLTTESRLLALEHPLINIIAIALITIGWSKHKKLMTSESKFKTFSIFLWIGIITYIE